jgi:hypothetical protein
VDRLLGPARLERPVVRTVARAVASLIVCALAAPGCFDVRVVDPGPLVIDDFDDGDLAPALASFDSWGCYSFNAQGASINCDHVQGTDNSPFALYVDFRVDDPRDGKQQHGGAALASWGRAPVDINPYQDLVFSAMLASGSPALPSDARLYVELGCSTAVGEDGSRPGDFYVLASADYKNYWQPFRIDVTSLGQPPWVVNKIEGGPARCRQLIDSIRFTVDAHLADGQSGQAVLTIDGIYLQ